ncbi:PREDICTED: BTB/POZ domain-containing protein At3g50780-like [Tarenaya hassleriana]|uniref:BTB/POZ domain-containing protein At3g50780-like n=1 Tax=Tarenaya hassleriana TaxID=28532 RepID=UPI00053C1EB4|nr:PREDICTED: BTB/POZ domain-containing protein At3g50780-like [Tarenaya hassleriana]
MAEIRLAKVEESQTKIRSVPIAVTPEGFWCCPSPAAFQKTLKSQNHLNKSKPSSPPPKPSFPKNQKPETEQKPASATIRSIIASDDQQQGLRLTGSDMRNIAAPAVPERSQRQKVETLPRKVAIEFGEPGTSDMKVILLGKQGFCVKLSVHKNVLSDNSSFFANKLAEKDPGISCLEIERCEDVEIYIETVGLMYCKDMKHRLMKQSVSRVLRVLKVAENLGFRACIQSCLDYLEAVPWVGEEEEKVISSILRLKHKGFGVMPALKRVASDIVDPPKGTLSHIIELVLRSREEKGRREMKAVVLKLLREQNSVSSADNFNETIYSSCQNCLDSVLSLFRQAAEAETGTEPASKQIAVEADNLSWLLDILAERQGAEEFAVTWANQKELISLHEKLPLMLRYHISRVTSRLFIGIGRGELLPSKDTRLALLRMWLQPLINDYNWLQHGCRWFDAKLVEEGIGQTILTLPLEDQQSILLSWLGSFLSAGNGCPNLQGAFEVWWRRSFIRPYTVTDRPGNGLFQAECSTNSSWKEE